MAERHRVILEAILAGMALRPRLLADLLEGRRGGREIAVEALDALSRAVERAEGGVALRERAIDAAKAGDERRLSALARRIIEATPPSLRHLLHGLVDELKAGKTPKEAVEALRPKLAELAREAAEAFEGAEDVDYLAKSFGVRSSSEEEILRAFEDAFLRAAERLAKLPEDRRRDVLGYIERRLGRLLKVAGIAALGVTLAVLANDPSWLRRSAEAIAAVNVHAVLPVIAFGMVLAKRVGAEEATKVMKNVTAAVIRREALERAEKLAKDIERTVAVREGNVIKLVVDGAEIGRIVEEKIKKKHADTRLAIKARDLYVELELNERRLLKAVRSEELRKFGEGLGHKAFVAAARRFGEGAGVMEGVFASALALEKYLAELGERAEKAVEGMWHKIGRMWEDGVVHNTAFKLLRKYFGAEIMELLAEIEKKAEEIEKEARDERIFDPYSRLPRELKRALVEAFLDRAPEVLGALRRGDLWTLQEIERGASEAKELPELKEYVERLEGIADLLKAATRELTERAEGEKRYGLVEINGKLYPAYEGPVELSARVEHVERDGKKYAVIEVKYGDRTAKVELDIEELRRSGLLHNLAAIATDDRRVFYEGYVSHGTASYFQAAERPLMWAIFMPGEYKITVERVRATEEGLSPEIVISSHFGQGGLAMIENSPIHRLVLKLARELAGGENLLKVKGAANKVLAASWLLVSAILSTPDGGRPSEGLAVLAERGVLPRAAFDRLRPIFEELDKTLGSISRVDKAYLVGKMVDYDGYIKEGFLRVRAEAVKETTIKFNGVDINMADVAEAAAKAFWKEGGWSGGYLYFGPAREALELEADEKAPLKIPAFKATAALMAELRQKELVEYVELYRREIDRGEIRIMAPKTKEESVQIAQLEAIWREFKEGKYTHLRLAVRGEEYELFYSGGRFAIRGEEAQKLKKALEELGLDVKTTSGSRIRFGYERLEKLLSAGVKAYAVRKAKKGEAMWRLEITYKGVTVMLKMTYDEYGNRLMKGSRTGKIEAIVYEEGAAKGETVELDLDLLAAAGRNCEDCLEKRLAEAFAAASEKGFRWSVTGDRESDNLYVYLPSDFRDAVRRFYSNT